MLRVSNKDNEPETVHAAYVYHPQSDALEKKMRQLVAEELARFGLDSRDYHEIRNDIAFARELRQTRKRTVVIAGRAILLGTLTLLGSLISAGFYTMINRSQP